MHTEWPPVFVQIPLNKAICTKTGHLGVEFLPDRTTLHQQCRPWPSVRRRHQTEGTTAEAESVARPSQAELPGTRVTRFSDFCYHIWENL